MADRLSNQDFPGQHPGEVVELVFRQHPIVLRKPLIYGLLIIVVSELPLLLLPDAFNTAVKIFLAGVVIALLYWFYEWLGWHYSVYIVTNSRLIDIKQKGFFDRKVNEVGFNKIQSINYHIKGFQAAVFKFGNITVQTYTNDWELSHISHPVEVHTKIMEVGRGLIGSTPPIK
jgi:uncharacterized membrane protein YdbT with pleckstrin-like domain